MSQNGVNKYIYYNKSKKEYKIKNDIKNRKCFDVGGDGGVCEYKENFVVFDDDELRISVLTKYQPQWCPVDLDINDAFEIENDETKDRVLKSCFGLADNTFDGSTSSFSIDRSTLKYSQTISNRKIFMHKGELAESKTRGYNFTSKIMSWYEDEVGKCELYKKRF